MVHIFRWRMGVNSSFALWGGQQPSPGRTQDSWVGAWRKVRQYCRNTISTPIWTDGVGGRKIPHFPRPWQYAQLSPYHNVPISLRASLTAHYWTPSHLLCLRPRLPRTTPLMQSFTIHMTMSHNTYDGHDLYSWSSLFWCYPGCSQTSHKNTSYFCT